MGIVVSNAAMSTALTMMRTSGLPATLPLAYAAARSIQPGMSFAENGRELVALLRSKGWEKSQELRVQWAASPPAPAQLVTDVRNALAQAGNGLGGISTHNGTSAQNALGAQAFTAGQSPVFGNAPDQATLPHELTHTVQQRQGTQN